MSRIREAMRDRRVAAAVAILALVAAGYRVALWRKAGRPAGAQLPAQAPALPVVAQPAAARAEPARDGGALAPRVAPGEVRWDWNRNPFLSGRSAGGAGGANAAVAASADDAPSGLKGTVISEGTALAVFGNRIVPAGERCGGWTVTRVEPYGVTLRRGAQERVVELYRPAQSGGPGNRGGRR